MALSRVKTWNAAETLTASDLNAEFNNICNHFGSLTNADIDSTASYVMGELVVGTGITSADGGQLHVHTATAGTIQAVADADEAVFENSGASGITILSGATSTGNIAFGDSGDADNGLIKYTHGSTPTLGVTVNATAVQSIAAAATTLAHDLEIYQDVNNADSAVKVGTSATEALFVEALNGASNKTLEELRFTTKTASGTANHGKMSFYVDEVNIGNVNDGGITLESGMVLTGNVTGNASGTAATVTGGTQAAITTCANLVTAGALNAGSITSGFGTIDTGSSTITTTGALAAGATTISGDTVVANGYGLIVGNTAQVATNTLTGEAQIQGTANNDSLLSISRYSADSTPPRLHFAKSRNATIGNVTGAVQSGDDLGSVGFCGSDGTDFNNLSASIGAVVSGSVSSDTVPADLIFGTGGTERMRIDSSGNVGIGTSSPGGKLSIYDSTAADYTAMRIYQGGDADYYWDFTADVDAGDLIIAANHSSFDLILNPTQGNVGIGTSSPAHAIDVSGTAGLSTGTAWTNTSDARIKTDVTTITGATAKLKQLRPVSFRYTDQYLSVHSEISGSKTYHSFIADEYETVFPDAVSVQGDLIKTTPATYYADGDDLPDGKSVGDEKTAETSETLLTNLKQYTPHDLQMFVVAAVQELDARIAALEAA